MTALCEPMFASPAHCPSSKLRNIRSYALLLCYISKVRRATPLTRSQTTTAFSFLPFPTPSLAPNGKTALFELLKDQMDRGIAWGTKFEF